MALSFVTHPADGVDVSFSYAALAGNLLDPSYSPVSAQLVVYVDGVAQTLTTDYTVDTGNEEIDFVSAPANGTTVKIAREMDREELAFDWQDITTLTALDLSTADKQLFYLVQEIIDDIDDSLTKGDDGNWDAEGLRITNLGTAVNSTDAVTLAQLNAAVSGVLPATVTGYGVYTATATGGQTTFSLTGGPSSRTTADYLVFVNGLQQQGTTHYTVTTGTPDSIVFTTGLALNDRVEVRWTTGVIDAELAASAVGTSAIADGAVTEAKIDGTGGTNKQVLQTNGTVASFATLDATYISNFDTQVRTSRLDQMAVPNSALSMNSQKITNLGTPTANTDAATKAYADGQSTAGMYYQNLQFTGSTASISINPGFSPRVVMMSSNSGTDDWSETAIFTGDGSAYTYTHDAVDYTVTRVSSSEVTVARSPASGSFNIRTFTLRDP
jgi:hypothetical protein